MIVKIICMDCQKEMGEKEANGGEISHGLCKTCLAIRLQQVIIRRQEINLQRTEV